MSVVAMPFTIRLPILCSAVDPLCLDSHLFTTAAVGNHMSLPRLDWTRDGSDTKTNGCLCDEDLLPLSVRLSFPLFGSFVGDDLDLLEP